MSETVDSDIDNSGAEGSGNMHGVKENGEGSMMKEGPCWDPDHPDNDRGVNYVMVGRQDNGDPRCVPDPDGDIGEPKSASQSEESELERGVRSDWQERLDKEEDPCEDGWTMVGLKDNGNPRCVPEEDVDDYDPDKSAKAPTVRLRDVRRMTPNELMRRDEELRRMQAQNVGAGITGEIAERRMELYEEAKRRGIATEFSAKQMNTAEKLMPLPDRRDLEGKDTEELRELIRYYESKHRDERHGFAPVDDELLLEYLEAIELIEDVLADRGEMRLSDDKTAESNLRRMAVEEMTQNELIQHNAELEMAKDEDDAEMARKIDERQDSLYAEAKSRGIAVEFVEEVEKMTNNEQADEPMADKNVSRQMRNVRELVTEAIRAVRGVERFPDYISVSDVETIHDQLTDADEALDRDNIQTAYAMVQNVRQNIEQLNPTAVEPGTVPTNYNILVNAKENYIVDAEQLLADLARRDASGRL